MADAGGGASSSASNAAAGGHNNLRPPSPLDGGAFLLQLLQKPSQTPPQPPPSHRHDHHQHHHFDPAVAAIGPDHPGHPVLPHDLFHPRPPPTHHLPPRDPQLLLPSLPLPLPQQFPSGIWSPAPPGFPPLGDDGSGLNHQNFRLDHQRFGLAAAGGSMASVAAPPQRSDLGVNPGRQNYGDKGIGDHAVVAPGRKHSGARNQGERSSFRPPPGFWQPSASRGAEYDRGSARLGGHESRSNQLKPQAEWSTVFLGHSNHLHGDRGRGTTASPWQRKVVEQGKQYGQACRQPSSGHWEASVEVRDRNYRLEEGGRVSQDNHQNHSEEVIHHRRLPTGDIPRGKDNFSAELEHNKLPVGFCLPLDSQRTVADNFDEGSDKDSEDDGIVEENLTTVERLEILNGDEDVFSAKRSTSREQDELCEQTRSSLTLMVKEEVKSVVAPKSSSRDKDFRSDLSRGHHVSSMRIRIQMRTVQCRYDIDALSPKFLSLFESLIPAEEEKAKQKQLIMSLEKLVSKEWPNARLYLYGSCANSFGVSKSDIDVCLSIDDKDISKIDILLKLAEILESGNLQNVQALTRARVPIVKLMDPVTGLSCDICINNLLAVVNTKLLKDYAQIDDRLRQLAFVVKHWARSRRVNETYQGTLSSYAYVLMCIHFLQLRRPAVLPCLQAMDATFVVTVDNTLCAYFDQVERLRTFGSRNKESIARLLWGFFHYWAYRHDYTNNVISVRTGSILSKQAKDWTRRIGNDRHLICIEDPFEISHDLGRVVDKHSIKILREEFERAANILQHDPNPTVTLFEPYIR